MVLIGRLVEPSWVVLDVGAHIGYITRWLAALVPEGRVFAFEPSSENRRYLARNVLRMGNVTVVPCGASDENGVSTLYVDDLTGQNSSLVKDFGRLKANSESAFVEAKVALEEVPTVRLDDFAAGRQVDFIKVDVEGFELSVLRGAKGLLARDRPAMMVEVQADFAEIFDMLSAVGYALLTPSGRRIVTPGSLHYNTFCLHMVRHAEQLRLLGVASP